MNQIVRTFRLRTAHVLYATTVLAASLATFRLGGLIGGLATLALWAYVFLHHNARRGFIHVCIVLGLLFLAWLTESMSTCGPPWQSYCASNLRQLGLALHDYYDAYKSFPPAYTTDQNGRPMHSWRVLILPFVGSRTLYRKYNFNEPWDGPNNRKLLAQMPYVFRCPGWGQLGVQTDALTSYVAVVDARTAWRGATTTGFDDITEPPSQVIHLVEVDPAGLPWTQPRDITLQEAIEMLSSPPPKGGHCEHGFFYDTLGGRNVAMCDGSSLFINYPVARDVVASLLIVGDGRRLPVERFHPYGLFPATKQWHLGNCYRFAILVLVAILPLPWVWLGHPRENDTQENPYGCRNNGERGPSGP